MGKSNEVFTATAVADDGSKPSGKRNPFGGLIDNAKGLYQKAKTEVQQIDTDKIGDGVGKLGRGIADQVDRIGAGQIGQTTRDVTGAAERQIKGEGTPEDRKRLVKAGVDAGKLVVGGGSLNLADKVVQNTGILPGGIEGLFNRGAKEVTKLDTLGFVKAVRDNFSKLDKDGNGFVSDNEVKDAGDDKLFALRNAHMMDVLKRQHQPLSNCQNDEIGSESKGVSMADLRALEKGRLEGTGFGGIAGVGNGAWDAKYLALAGSGTTAYLNYGKVGTGKLFTRTGLVTTGLFAVGGAYGAIDYYGSRKGNIETLISELK